MIFTESYHLIFCTDGGAQVMPTAAKRLTEHIHRRGSLHGAAHVDQNSSGARCVRGKCPAVMLVCGLPRRRAGWVGEGVSCST